VSVLVWVLAVTQQYESPINGALGFEQLTDADSTPAEGFALRLLQRAQQLGGVRLGSRDWPGWPRVKIIPAERLNCVWVFDIVLLVHRVFLSERPVRAALLRYWQEKEVLPGGTAPLDFCLKNRPCGDARSRLTQTIFRKLQPALASLRHGHHVSHAQRFSRQLRQ
jgi:hypothetical protein